MLLSLQIKWLGFGAVLTSFTNTRDTIQIKRANNIALGLVKRRVKLMKNSPRWLFSEHKGRDSQCCKITISAFDGALRMQNEFTAVFHPYSSIQCHRTDFPLGSEQERWLPRNKGSWMRAAHRLQWLSIVKSFRQSHLCCDAVRIVWFDCCFEVAHPSIMLFLWFFPSPQPPGLCCLRFGQNAWISNGFRSLKSLSVIPHNSTASYRDLLPLFCWGC